MEEARLGRVLTQGSAHLSASARQEPVQRALRWPRSLQRGRWDAPRIAVVTAALASALLTVILRSTVFSHLSVNNDESVYLLQARALAKGHLFPAVSAPASSFTPWLGVIHGDHYVLKYTPVVAAFFAVSLVLTGGYVAGLAVLAMGLVASTYLLAKEVTGSRPVAATAAVLLAASPVVIVQSALLLPYVLFMILAELALWALLVGARCGSRRHLAMAGLCGGLAVVARPFDAVLLLGPLALWLLWRTPSPRWRLVAGVALGALGPALALLWFDNAATGSPLRLPFSLFQSGDTLGFGVHRLYSGEAARRFGIAQGWQGLARHLSLLGGGWAFGGVLLAALAVVALVKRRVSAAGLAILVGGVLLVVGYLFFWGIWNAAIVWGGVRYLGPYYLMPLLIPMSILGALGLREIAHAGAWRAGLTLLLAAGVSASAVVPALSADSALNTDNAVLAKIVASQGNSLVFVDTYPSLLQHPTAVISNEYPVGGRTVYALARGGDDFAVARAFTGRSLYRLRLLGEYGKRPHAGYGAQLDRVTDIAGRTLTLHVAVTLPASAISGRLVITVGSHHESWRLQARTVTRLQLTLVGATAQPGVIGAGLRPGEASDVSLVLQVDTARVRAHVVDRLKLPLLLAAGGQLHALSPAGVVAELGPLPPPALQAQVTR